MTPERLYQSYRANLLENPFGGADPKYKIERILGANKILFYFLANIFRIGIENSHLVLLYFTVRISKELGLNFIPRDKISDTSHNVLSDLNIMKFLKWMDKEEFEKGFPELDVNLDLALTDDVKMAWKNHLKENPIALTDEDILKEWGLSW